MHGPFIKYWIQPLPQMVSSSPLASIRANQTKSIVTIAFLSAVTALFQSAGGFLPGFGYLISPLSTAPMVLATLISFRSGLTAYVLSNLLLLFIQPSELIIFPFTTGLLGIALGFFIASSKNRIQVVLFFHNLVMDWNFTGVICLSLSFARTVSRHELSYRHYRICIPF